MNQWYYADGRHERQGPIDDVALAGLHAAGHIGPGTLVWREGMVDWQRLGDLSTADAQDVMAGQAAAALAASSPLLDNSAVTVGPADPFPVPKSPYAPPAAPLLHGTGVVSGHEVVYAGFWKRVAAYVIDGTIVGIAGAIIGALIGGIMGAAFGLNGGLGASGILGIQLVAQVVSLAISASYFALFHASSGQATPGKLAVGIKVARSDGSRMTVARGVGRYFALIVSAVTLGIGFLMAAFTVRKQALHDLICDTLVVDKWAFTDFPERQRRDLGGVTIVVLILGTLLALAVAAVMGLAIAKLGGTF